MNCPVCQGPMYDNRTNKKNPKGPDYTCKQANGPCKFIQDSVSKEWLPGEYKTGIWLPKEGGFGQYAKRPTPKTPEASPAMPPVGTYQRSPLLVEKETHTIERVPEEGGPDWKLIGEQKNRSNLAAAILQGKPLDFDTLEKVEAWVITGKKPDTELDDLAAGIPTNF